MKIDFGRIQDQIIFSSAEAEHLWEIICTYKLSFGAEYLSYKYGWSADFAEGSITEYKRFAFLALISKSEVTPSLTIDEVWHCHILHTLDYEKFAAACGKKLHHHPGLPGEQGRWDSQYERTARLYKKLFNNLPPAKYWGGLKRQPKMSDALEVFKGRITRAISV